MFTYPPRMAAEGFPMHQQLTSASYLENAIFTGTIRQVLKINATEKQMNSTFV